MFFISGTKFTAAKFPIYQYVAILQIRKNPNGGGTFHYYISKEGFIVKIDL